MLAFFMAVVLAGIFTWLVFKRIRASMGHQGTVKIVAAVNELPAGVALSEKDVELMDWPNDVPITGTFSKIQDVVGHPLIRSLGAKEPIFQRDLGSGRIGSRPGDEDSARNAGHGGALERNRRRSGIPLSRLPCRCHGHHQRCRTMAAT